MTREEKMKKHFSKIQLEVDKLHLLGYHLSDRDSTICLFDDRMFKKTFHELTDSQHEEMIMARLQNHYGCK